MLANHLLPLDLTLSDECQIDAFYIQHLRVLPKRHFGLTITLNTDHLFKAVDRELVDGLFGPIIPIPVDF